MTDAPPIRRATPDDAAACAAVVHGWVTGTSWMPARFSLGELEGMIRNGLPIREIYVVGDPVAGYLSFNPENNQVVGLYTNAPGRGLGKALMDHVKAQNDYLQLWTHEPNTAAHRFYDREGFCRVERNPEGGDGLPELRMEWMRHAIRPATPEDASACAAILNAWIDARDWMPRIHSKEDVRAFYQDFVLTQRTVWVAGDPVVGFMAMNPADATVTALYVATPGRGLGKAFLDMAKSRHDTVQLWTFQANEGARKFYAREGFREVKRTDGDNEEGLPDVLLEWDAV